MSKSSEFKYVERDGVVHRFKEGSAKREAAVKGKWVRVSADEGLKAVNFGCPMDEAGAREFAAKCWPADEAVAV